MVPKGGSSSLRQRWLNKERDFGVRAPELDQIPPLPAGAAYLFSWFADLATARGNNGFGPAPISAAETLAWSQLTGHRLTPWEFRAIRALDRAWVSKWAEFNPPD